MIEVGRFGGAFFHEYKFICRFCFIQATDHPGFIDEFLQPVSAIESRIAAVFGVIAVFGKVYRLILSKVIFFVIQSCLAIYDFILTTIGYFFITASISPDFIHVIFIIDEQPVVPINPLSGSKRRKIFTAAYTFEIFKSGVYAIRNVGVGVTLNVVRPPVCIPEVKDKVPARTAACIFVPFQDLCTLAGVCVDHINIIPSFPESRFIGMRIVPNGVFVITSQIYILDLLILKLYETVVA